jgi:hypothetical protein
VIMPALVNACQRRMPAPNNACLWWMPAPEDACHRSGSRRQAGPGSRLRCGQALVRAGVEAEQACVPRQASPPPAGMGTEQARPPTAAKPTVAAADPLRPQPGSAQECATKTKGA